MNSTMNVAEVQLSYKSDVRSSTRHKTNSSQGAYELLIKYFPDNIIEYKKSFKVVLFNRSNKMPSIVPVLEGGVSATYVDVRLMLQAASLVNATQVILAHNHSPGSAKPSTPDNALAEKIGRGAELVEIHVADHTVLSSEEGHHSYYDEGKL